MATFSCSTVVTTHSAYQPAIGHGEVVTREILHSVATRGLLSPGVHTRLTNASDHDLTYICFNILNLTMKECHSCEALAKERASFLLTGLTGGEHIAKDSKNLRAALLDESGALVSKSRFGRSLRSLVSELSTGALSVSIERKEVFNWAGSTPKLIAELSQRVQHSVLLIFNPRSALEKDTAPFIKRIYDFEDHCSGDVLHYECRTRCKINPGDYLAVFAPIHLYQDTLRCFPDEVKVIPVEERLQNVEVMELGFSPMSLDPRYDLPSPNYRAGLERFLGSFPQTLIGTHVVRLPVCERVCLVFDRARAAAIAETLNSIDGLKYNLSEISLEKSVLEISQRDMEREVTRDALKKVVRVRHKISVPLLKACFYEKDLEKLSIMRADPEISIVKAWESPNQMWVYVSDEAARSRAYTIYSDTPDTVATASDATVSIIDEVAVTTAGVTVTHTASSEKKTA